MRTETVTLYKFEELSKESQKKVLEKHYNINVDSNDWYESIYEDWKNKLTNIGFKDVRILFSGFYSQGDGACFDCTSFNVTELATNLGYNELEKKVLENLDIWISIETINTHYYHYNTRRANILQGTYLKSDTQNILKIPINDLPLEISKDLSDEALEFLEFRLKHSDLPAIFINELLEKFLISIEKLRATNSKSIYEALYKEYKELITDEAVRDTIIANDYDFTKDGEIWSQ